MGKTVLTALVVVWMFNLARLVASGVPAPAAEPEVAAPAPPSIAADVKLRPIPGVAAILSAAGDAAPEARAGVDSSAHRNAVVLDAAPATADPE